MNRPITSCVPALALSRPLWEALGILEHLFAGKLHPRFFMGLAFAARSPCCNDFFPMFWCCLWMQPADPVSVRFAKNCLRLELFAGRRQ